MSFKVPRIMIDPSLLIKEEGMDAKLDDMVHGWSG